MSVNTFRGSLLFLFCLFVGTVTPAIEIIDPNELLASLEKELKASPWELANSCGGAPQKFYRDQIKCEIKCGAFCLNQCVTAEGSDQLVQLVIEDCQADSMAIYGSNNLALTLTKNDYQATGTFIVPLLKEFNHFLTPIQSATIRRIDPSSIEIVRQGKAVRMPAKVVVVEFEYAPQTQRISYEFVFLPGQNLLSSLAIIRENPFTPGYFLKQQGVISAH